MIVCRFLRKSARFLPLFCLSLLGFGQVPPNNAPTVPVHLQVETGTPLRLYATKRVWYRQGELIQAKTAAPVWAFDRVVIPVGTTVEGQIVQLEPEPKMVRAMSMIRGDFTPLKKALVSFNRMVLPDGRAITLDTQPSFGLASIYVPSKPQKKSSNSNKPPANPNSVGSQFRTLAKQQLQAQANARTRGMLDFVRAPNKREWLEDYMWAKLPYHPQFYRGGTRFDAILNQPLDFGSVDIPAKTIDQIGNQPLSDTPVEVRLLSTVTSKDSRVGEPIKGVLSEPSFASDHSLVLPQGTELTGKITLCRPARFFHRGGQLRFTFDNVDAQKLTFAAVPSQPIQAQLTDAEETSGTLKVDSEGTVKATEPKTRLLRPVLAGLIAAKSMDNDEGKQTASGTGNGNFTGTTLGGFSGFGLFGMAIAQGPKPIGTALGFYGLAWSVYTTVVSRGNEVRFQKNSAVAIRFAARR